jgi:hypothetical protein
MLSAWLAGDQQAVAGLNLPKGDLMMFNDKRVVVCDYYQTGRVTQQTFYDENDNIAKFLQLKLDLLPHAQPLLST